MFSVLVVLVVAVVALAVVVVWLLLRLRGTTSTSHAVQSLLAGADRTLDERFRSTLEHLKTANEGALKLAEEKFDKHNRSAKAGVDSTVGPVKEGLERFTKLVQEMETSRKTDETALKKEIEHLAKSGVSLQQETNRLARALSSPKSRGRWGEMQLRNVFELAGMANHVDFEEQHTLVGAEGALRPDATVRIPNGRALVVDAKTPLDNYLKALDAEDDEQYRTSMRSYANDLSNHIKALAAKEYAQSVRGEVEYVVMFVPSDQFLAAAAEYIPDLVEKAFQKKILVCTPATLIALLKVVAYGWQQRSVSKHADEILKIGRELLERLTKYQEHFDKLGRSLTTSVKDFNSALGSFDRRVLPAARKIGILSDQTRGHDELRELDAINDRPRFRFPESE